jgi:hypothetical protein
MKDYSTDGVSFVELLAKGDYATLNTKLDANMKDLFPPHKFQGIWEGFITTFGAFQKVSFSWTDFKNEVQAVIVDAQFEKETIQLMVAFDKDGLVGAFGWKA